MIATYGEGDPPDNCMPFFKFLEELPDKSPSDDKPTLGEMRFTMFGLGDSFFTGTFNNASKTVYNHLKRCGATQFY